MTSSVGKGLVVVNAPRHTCGTKGMKEHRKRRFAKMGCPACALDEHLGLREVTNAGVKVITKKCPSCGHSHSKKSLCRECKREGRICRGHPSRSQ